MKKFTLLILVLVTIGAAKAQSQDLEPGTYECNSERARINVRKMENHYLFTYKTLFADTYCHTRVRAPFDENLPAQYEVTCEGGIKTTNLDPLDGRGLLITGHNTFTLITQQSLVTKTCQSWRGIEYGCEPKWSTWVFVEDDMNFDCRKEWIPR